MANYIIGDIHGCADEFAKLISEIGFNKSLDTLFLTGDLVGRGNKPLEVLELAQSLDAQWVLGNHDLHLLGVYHGVRKNSELDNFQQLFESSKLDYWLDYIQKQPFAIMQDDFFLSHAGYYPTWTQEEAFNKAQELSVFLQQANKEELQALFTYNNLTQDSTELEMFTFYVNCFSVIRMLKPHSKQDSSIRENKYVMPFVLDYKHKGSQKQQNSELSPWFTKLTNFNRNVFFGHWSNLEGIVQVQQTQTQTTQNQAAIKHSEQTTVAEQSLELDGNPAAKIYCLDTSCVYGGTLTAINLNNKEIISVQKY